MIDVSQFPLGSPALSPLVKFCKVFPQIVYIHAKQLLGAVDYAAIEIVKQKQLLRYLKWSWL